MSLYDNIYQTAFQEQSWKSVVENTSKVVKTVAELACFVQSQMFEEIQSDFISQKSNVEQTEREKNETVGIKRHRLN